MQFAPVFQEFAEMYKVFIFPSLYIINKKYNYTLYVAQIDCNVHPSFIFFFSQFIIINIKIGGCANHKISAVFFFFLLIF
jgi:hypothetical protein